MTRELTFGEWLEDLYIRKGMQQGEFAERIDAAQSTVSGWVNYGVKPRRRLIPAIARVLDVTEEEVLRRAGLLRSEKRSVREEVEPFDDSTPNGVYDRRRLLLEKMDGFTDEELDLVEVVIDQIRRNRERKGRRTAGEAMSSLA